MNYAAQKEQYLGNTAGLGAPQAPQSEFDSEMTRLRLAAEANQELVRQLAERLYLVRHQQPEGKNGKTLEATASSPLAGQIRDRTNTIDCSNEVLRDILGSLAI